MWRVHSICRPINWPDSLPSVRAPHLDRAFLFTKQTIFMYCFLKAQDIGSVKFSHCRRDARFSFDSKAEVDWVGDPPSFIIQDLLFDVTIVWFQ